jgi:hypothetical protein
MSRTIRAIVRGAGNGGELSFLARELISRRACLSVGGRVFSVLARGSGACVDANAAAAHRARPCNCDFCRRASRSAFPKIMNAVFLADVVTRPAGFSSEAASWAMMLTVTLVIELSVVAIAWRITGRFGSLRRWFIAGLIGNVVSHPAATFLWLWLPPLSRFEKLAAFAIIEFLVTIFEAWVYQRIARCPAALALLFSALANGVTGAIAVYLVFVR